MMVVAAGGVALATALAGTPSAETETGTQTSVEVASAVRPISAPASLLRVQPRASALRVAIAPLAVPPPAVVHRLELSPDHAFVPALSSPPRASRGPPTPSILDR
jgi:hypothetical protein